MLGSCRAHGRKDRLGKWTSVLKFSHLMIQEFVSAIWLSVLPRRDQCPITQSILHSIDNSKMIFRFLCVWECFVRSPLFLEHVHFISFKASHLQPICWIVPWLVYYLFDLVFEVVNISNFVLLRILRCSSETSTNSIVTLNNIVNLQQVICQVEKYS